MKVLVSTFSSVKTLCGFAEKELDLKEQSSVRDALTAVLNECGNSNNLKNKLLYAVNEEYCDESRELHNGDQLAIFPPVSGG
jgi:sulfur-carrier protein